jgi:8-oxo-dGTP diphosphatase
VDVIESWTGRYACLLQSALRDTNEGFAARLGIGQRTVASWHADPELVPRPEMQQLLDQILEKAPTTVQKRFGLPAAEANGQAGPFPNLAVRDLGKGREASSRSAGTSPRSTGACSDWTSPWSSTR